MLDPGVAHRPVCRRRWGGPNRSTPGLAPANGPLPSGPASPSTCSAAASVGPQFFLVFEYRPFGVPSDDEDIDERLLFFHPNLPGEAEHRRRLFLFGICEAALCFAFGVCLAGYRSALLPGDVWPPMALRLERQVLGVARHGALCFVISAPPTQPDDCVTTHLATVLRALRFFNGPLCFPVGPLDAPQRVEVKRMAAEVRGLLDDCQRGLPLSALPFLPHRRVDPDLYLLGREALQALQRPEGVAGAALFDRAALVAHRGLPLEVLRLVLYHAQRLQQLLLPEGPSGRGMGQPVPRAGDRPRHAPGSPQPWATPSPLPSDRHPFPCTTHLQHARTEHSWLTPVWLPNTLEPPPPPCGGPTEHSTPRSTVSNTDSDSGPGPVLEADERSRSSSLTISAPSTSPGPRLDSATPESIGHAASRLLFPGPSECVFGDIADSPRSFARPLRTPPSLTWARLEAESSPGQASSPRPPPPSATPRSGPSVGGDLPSPRAPSLPPPGTEGRWYGLLLHWAEPVTVAVLMDLPLLYSGPYVGQALQTIQRSGLCQAFQAQPSPQDHSASSCSPVDGWSEDGLAGSRPTSPVPAVSQRWPVLHLNTDVGALTPPNPDGPRAVLRAAAFAYSVVRAAKEERAGEAPTASPQRVTRVTLRRVTAPGAATTCTLRSSAGGIAFAACVGGPARDGLAATVPILEALMEAPGPE